MIRRKTNPEYFMNKIVTFSDFFNDLFRGDFEYVYQSAGIHAIVKEMPRHYGWGNVYIFIPNSHISIKINKLYNVASFDDGSKFNFGKQIERNISFYKEADDIGIVIGYHFNEQCDDLVNKQDVINSAKTTVKELVSLTNDDYLKSYIECYEWINKLFRTASLELKECKDNFLNPKGSDHDIDIKYKSIRSLYDLSDDIESQIHKQLGVFAEKYTILNIKEMNPRWINISDVEHDLESNKSYVNFKSTQNGLGFCLEFDGLWHIIDHATLWREFKRIRTKFLIKEFRSINPY